MKSMKKKIQICLFLILIIVLIFGTISRAENISYYIDGSLKKIETQNVIIAYLGADMLDEISVNNGEVVINFWWGQLSKITTPSGTVEFDLSEKIYDINGNWLDICKEVEEALKEANTEVINYITSIKIQIPGASNPSESADIITDSLNKIIDKLNASGAYVTSDHSGEVTNSASSNSVSNSVNVLNNKDANHSSSDVSISIPGLGGITANDNGVFITGPDLTINDSTDNKDSNIFTYIIIGIICYVVLLIILFVIKTIQGEKVNIRLIKVAIAVISILFLIFIALILFLNL